MAIEQQVLQQAADRLWKAEHTRTPCDPVRNIVPENDAPGAYAVQQLNIDRHVRSGRRISGRKIGLTARPVQQQMGVFEPDFGTLFADMEYGHGSEIPFDRLIAPRIEAEIMLVLERDLDHEMVNFSDVLRASAFAIASIEVVDCRYRNWDIRICDTVSDNAAAGVYVLGASPRSVIGGDLDPAAVLSCCRPGPHRHRQPARSSTLRQRAAGAVQLRGPAVGRYPVGSHGRRRPRQRIWTGRRSGRAGRDGRSVDRIPSEPSPLEPERLTQRVKMLPPGRTLPSALLHGQFVTFGGQVPRCFLAGDEVCTVRFLQLDPNGPEAALLIVGEAGALLEQDAAGHWQEAAKLTDGLSCPSVRQALEDGTFSLVPHPSQDIVVNGTRLTAIPLAPSC